MNNRAHQLRDALPDLADRTHGQLCDLHKDTTEDRADLAARATYEVYTALRQLASELRKEEA